MALNDWSNHRALSLSHSLSLKNEKKEREKSTSRMTQLGQKKNKKTKNNNFHLACRYKLSKKPRQVLFKKLKRSKQENIKIQKSLIKKVKKNN